MAKKLLICGETAAGKDYFTKYLENTYGLKPVVSYATRPIRSNETDGVQHKFISDADADTILHELNSKDIVAYTKIGKYRYFATYDDLMDADTYIIDPEGIKYLKTIHPEIEYYVIYITCNEELRRVRAGIRGDNIKALNERIESERKQFENFKDYDVVFVNNRQAYDLEQFADEVVKRLDEIN